MAATTSWPDPIVRRIVQLCEANPDRESCGLVVRRGELLDVVEVPNVAGGADAAAARRHAYVMDPAALLHIHRDLAASGGSIAAVWHSHVDGTAAFSGNDRAEALAGGIEQVPGAEYIVVGLRARRASDVRRYRLVAGEFVDCALHD